ncbi:MAG: O-antigen ligase family protein [Candidatus Limivicinus sp.]|nr:O-antigen ligase family protein [Candidatus Limivicinus sp.]
MNIRRETDQNTLPVAVVIAALLAYVFHLLRYVHDDIWGSIYSVYYPCLIPILIAFTVYFRWGKWKKEEKLFLWFAVWVYISRLLNGDFFLANDADMVLNTGLSFVFMVICIALNRENRERLLEGISILTSGYFTLLSWLGLYSWLLRRELYNPLTGESICNFEGGLYRLKLYGRNSTEVTQWFFLSLFLLLYLFFRKKSLRWRIPIAAAAISNLLALTVTFSRSGRLAFAVCAALLVFLVILNRIPWRSGLTRLLVVLACIAVVTPLVYVGFNMVATGMQHSSAFLLERIQREETAAEPSQTLAAGTLRSSASVLMPYEADEIHQPEQTFTSSTMEALISENTNVAGLKAVPLNIKEDKRGLDDSGRMEIFRSIIPTIQQEPLRLLRGCMCRDVMSISNTVLPFPKPHFHNTFLQILCLTGLPGFLVILAICGLLSVKIIRLLFSAAPVEVKSLTLVLIGTFIYNMLEVSLFVAADTRAFVAYIIAGAVLAYSYELREDCAQHVTSS